MAPAELVEHFVFHPNCGFRTFADPAAYHAALSRNEAIAAELVRRDQASVGTCREHLGDMRHIFTGDGGDLLTVSILCHDLLVKLGYATDAPFSFRLCDH